MALVGRSYGYSKMAVEDPEEVQHRRAKFLIYKVMQKADTRKRPSWLRVKMFKLKVRVGLRLKRLRKAISSTACSAKVGFYKQISCQIKSWRRLLRGKEAVANLQPIFIC